MVYRLKMGGSFHGELLNNQMVYHLYQPRLWPQPYQPLENSSVSSWRSMAIWRSMAAPACVSFTVSKGYMPMCSITPASDLPARAVGG